MTTDIHPNLATALEAHRLAGLERRATMCGPAGRNQASAVGWPCPSGPRYLVLLRTVQPDPATAELQAIFEEGNAQEEVIARQLLRDGWSVIESEHPNKVWPDLQISGRIDREVTIPKGVAEALGLDYRTRYVGEFKSMSGASFERAVSIPAMLTAKQPWLRAYPVQLGLYLWLEERPRGIFVLKCKQTNAIRFLPMHMDEWVELIANAVERCRQANAHLAAGTVPEVTGYEAQACRRCRVRSACLPGERGLGAEVILDEEVIEALHQRAKSTKAAARFAAADGFIKSRLKALSAGRPGVWACDDWVLEVKLVPKHYRAQAARECVETVVAIRRVRGSVEGERVESGG